MKTRANTVLFYSPLLKTKKTAKENKTLKHGPSWGPCLGYCPLSLVPAALPQQWIMVLSCLGTGVTTNLGLEDYLWGAGTKTATKAIKLMIAKWLGVSLVTISGWARVKLLCLARFVFIFPVQLT